MIRWGPLGRSTRAIPDLTPLPDIGVLDEQTIFEVQALHPLFDRLRVQPDTLLDRMCPVQLPSGRCQVLVLAGHVQDDPARALLLRIRQAGFELAAPALLVVPPSVLSEIGRRSRNTPQADRSSASMSSPHHVLLAVLDDFVAWALKEDASDIHLTIQQGRSTADVAFSVNGRCVRPAEFQSVTVQTAMELLSVAWMSVRGGNGAVFDPAKEQQGRLERSIRGATVGLRWASLATQAGPSVCLRLLARPGLRQVPLLSDLGYTAEQLESLYRARLLTGGAVVFAGTVGSGKSTTLAALVRSIPPNRKVITLEDPVEYVMENALQCLVSGFDVSAGTEDLIIKLKTIKRSAAHDVLVGEIRDSQGGRALTDLVLSGTNVYTTVHASSALHILLRLGSSLIEVPDSLLAMPGVIKLLVYQVLLRRLCLDCALSSADWLRQGVLLCALGEPRPVPWATNWLARVCVDWDLDAAELRFRNPQGCGACRPERTSDRHGYQGRQLIAEMIEPGVIRSFYGALARRGLTAQVARWQADCDRSGQSELTGYRPVRQLALAYVRTGRVDMRDFEGTFGGLG